MDFADAFFVDASTAADPDEPSEALSTQMFDVDGDGFDETRVTHTDAGVTIARDADADGVIETFTSFGRDGGYQSWEIFRTADGSSRWERTESGEIFD